MRQKQVNPKKMQMQYRLYSPSSMTNAFFAVTEKNTSVKRASRTYNVPETTLRQRVLGRVHVDTNTSGTMPILSHEEEAIFVEHIKVMASVGYGYTRTEVVQMASEYAISLQKRDREHPFSLKWFRNFMKRWPELSVNKPRSLSIARAKATSKDVVDRYFGSLKEILDKHHLHDKPENIYNVDEKGLQTEHTPPYIVGQKDTSIPAITSARSAITTVIGCGNALGVQLPPYFVFKGQRMRQELLSGCTEGTIGTVTESGWSNSEVFQNFLQTHFLRYIQRRDTDHPILLLYDGHRSHISLPLINWAKQHHIILFVLPAHTSHALQPLDLGCFGPFQKIYNAECHKFTRQNPSSTITRYNVCSLACQAYIHALSPANLQSSFRKSGIYPFNPLAVDSTLFTPSTVLKNSAISQDITEEDNTVAGQPSNHTDIIATGTPEDFFKKKMDSLIGMKQEHASKSRKNLSNVISGKAITEAHIQIQIESHQQSSKLRSTKRKSSEFSRSAMKKSKIKPSSSSSSSRKTLKSSSEPKPGPSGQQIILLSEDSISESDPEEEKCCVCHKFQPEELKNCASIVFTKWAKCDFIDCEHWTHLKFCCKQTVIRLHDNFICPCHTEE